MPDESASYVVEAMGVLGQSAAALAEKGRSAGSASRSVVLQTLHN
jgi:hypothetical protein